MILDRQNCFSDGQALSGAGSAASTDLIDLGAIRQIGVGEPLYVVVNLPVAAGGTTPTLAVALQTDDNSSFSSPTAAFTSPTYAAAALVAGAQFVYPIPPTGMERYVRLNYTLGGTSPTATVDAHIVTSAQLDTMYPGNFVVA